MTLERPFATPAARAAASGRAPFVLPDPWVLQAADALAFRLRDMVLPYLGTMGARRLAGHAVGGDTTFAIDEAAEAETVTFLEGLGRPIAVYTEDQGLLTWGDPEHVLIVDPIDGTRPAMAGFEACCVSVAVAGWSAAPTMGDVVYGVVLEIKEGGVFRAARGQGASVEDSGGVPQAVQPSGTDDLSRLFWTIGFRGRPAAELVTVLGDLVDRSSVDGAVFDIGSAAYSMTRLLTGQLDAYIDVGPRMLEVAPWVQARFREVGNGAVLNNAPYDVAAAVLIAEEAGCVVSDAAGRPLAARPLLGSDMAHQMSVVASANPVVHRSILENVEQGMQRLAAAGLQRGAMRT